MHPDLVVGGRFPDLELPDHRHERVSRLGDEAGGTIGPGIGRRLIRHGACQEHGGEADSRSEKPASAWRRSCRNGHGWNRRQIACGVGSVGRADEAARRRATLVTNVAVAPLEID